MGKITAKEFVEKMNSGNLQMPLKLWGLVKRSEKASELMFSFKTEPKHWIKIPESMIDSVCLVKNITCKDEPKAIVKLHLKMPTDEQGKILYSLLSGLMEMKKKLYEKKMMLKKKLMMMGMHHGCGCGHTGMGMMHEEWGSEHSGCTHGGEKHEHKGYGMYHEEQ